MYYLITVIVSFYFAVGVSGASNNTLVSSNPDISLYVESNRNIPAFISGRLTDPIEKGEEVEATISFLEKNKSTYLITEPALELQVKKNETDRTGNRHLKFDQYYNGIRVQWGELASHIDTKGVLKAVNGTFHPGIELDVTPDIGSTEAFEIVQSYLTESFGQAHIDTKELIILPWDEAYYLCWHLFVQADSSYDRWEYFINAHTGTVIFELNAIRHSEEIGTGLSVMEQFRDHIDVWYDGSVYQLKDNTRQLNNNIHGHNGHMPDGNYIQTDIADETLPGPIGEDDDNYWSGFYVQPAVDAHVYAGLYYDWLLREFGRNSYDNNGSNMISSVNWTGTPNGAFWTGSQTVYPQWEFYFRSWAACPDVVAHEFTHGIIESSSMLVYTWESGALNEAFCNMIGAAFEFAHDTLDNPDWLLAENAFRLPGFVKSMSRPDSTSQPSYVGGQYWVEPEGCIPSVNNDYCGVHINCGVIHKWFYLLSEGGDFRNILVEGIGVENAIQIVYLANEYYWTSTVDFRNAAIGTYYAALDLDPTGAWAEQVVNGWEAVNVDIPVGGLLLEYPLGTPLTLQSKQETRVEVEVSGLIGGEPSPATGKLYYSIDGGPVDSTALIPESNNCYSVYLPALSCEQTLEYYFSAATTAGGTVFDPNPESPFIARIITDSNILFSDNFESDNGWTVYGNATDGIWQRDVPLVSGTTGAPTEDYDGSGSCYLTDNSAGESDVDRGSTNLVSPVFDLEGTDGIFSYAAYLNMRFDPTLIADDMLYVYLSNNNGTNWVLVDRIGPNPSFDGVWNEYSFLVSDFVSPTDQMKVRYEITDIGLESAVEAAIDAFEVTRYDCICCIDFTGNVNNDFAELVDIADLVFLVDYSFNGGPAPLCYDEADVDASSSLNIADIVYLAGYLFGGGAKPAACG